jgi:hypothetical protein
VRALPTVSWLNAPACHALTISRTENARKIRYDDAQGVYFAA